MLLVRVLPLGNVRDDLRWRLLMCKNEFSQIIFSVIHFYCILTISEGIWSVSACRKSMKVAGIACLSTKIRMATLREQVADLRCFSVYRDSTHLGLIRRLF